MKKNKVDMLNFLRIVAFLMIFFLHSKLLMPMPWDERVRFPWVLYTPAWAGVWIFFILSGYGIGYGFNSGKYKLSINSVVQYYLKRIKAIVPIYWFYLVVVLVFIVPSLLIPNFTNFHKLINLFLFNYQEEFNSIELGLAWYLTTLMRLYLIAPFIYFVDKKVEKICSTKIIVLGIVILLGFALRVAMGYHYRITGLGNWEANIYKPFYFNLDIFIGGFLLGKVKAQNARACSRNVLKGLSVILLFALLGFNVYAYYLGEYGQQNIYMKIYRYILPSIYIVVILFYINCFDIGKAYIQTKVCIAQIKQNWLRVIDCFQYIQFPLYLFHASVLLRLSNLYEEEIYNTFCVYLHIPPSYYDLAKSLLFMIFALIITLFWSIVVAIIINTRRESSFWCALENIDYKQKYEWLKSKTHICIKKIFPKKTN